MWTCFFICLIFPISMKVRRYYNMRRFEIMQGDKSDNTRKRGLDEVMSDSVPAKRLRKENCVDKKSSQIYFF